MSNSPNRRLLTRGPAAAAGALAAAIIATAPAAAGVNPPAIGPNQFFSAVVNGQTGHAQIFVSCQDGVGHPVPGQSVEVLPVAGKPSDRDGFTGTDADRVNVIASSAATEPVTQLNLRETPVRIPASAIVPCGGSGAVTFVPFPGSDTARPATVEVTYVVPPTPFA